jgi:hypothetical protein
VDDDGVSRRINAEDSGLVLAVGGRIIYARANQEEVAGMVVLCPSRRVVYAVTAEHTFGAQLVAR